MLIIFRFQKVGGFGYRNLVTGPNFEEAWEQSELACDQNAVLGKPRVEMPFLNEKRGLKTCLNGWKAKKMKCWRRR